jgi:hypothetical protein
MVVTVVAVMAMTIMTMMYPEPTFLIVFTFEP